MNARALVWGAVGAAILVGCQKSAPPGQASAGADTTRASGSQAAETTRASSAYPLMSQRLIEAANIALPPGVAPDSLPEPASAGATLLRKYCTQCHALPSPAMHGPADWPSVARRMWVRIDMMAGALGVQTPSTAQRAGLLDYLQKHALRVAAHLPPGAGKEVFEEVCARCHQLNDPRMHSPPDWPLVVMRMEQDAEKMKVRGITHSETAQIITYLQSASARLRAR
jgi:cytochrome c2